MAVLWPVELQELLEKCWFQLPTAKTFSLSLHLWKKVQFFSVEDFGMEHIGKSIRQTFDHEDVVPSIKVGPFVQPEE